MSNNEIYIVELYEILYTMFGLEPFRIRRPNRSEFFLVFFEPWVTREDGLGSLRKTYTESTPLWPIFLMQIIDRHQTDKTTVTVHYNIKNYVLLSLKFTPDISLIEYRNIKCIYLIFRGNKLFISLFIYNHMIVYNNDGSYKTCSLLFCPIFLF